MHRQELLHKLQGLDHELQQLLDQLRPYSHEVLNQSPKPGAWSAMQVLHHVKLSEFYSQQYCEKKLSFEPQLKQAGWLENVRAKLVVGYLRAPFRVKAPKAIAGPALPEESQLSAIETEWKAQRKSLAQFMAKLPDQYLDKAVYKHPMGGRLSFMGMLDFFQAHFRRHQQQIWRSIPR